MPSAAPRPCANPSCSKLVARGYCPECGAAHARKADAERGTAAARGYGSKWRAYRVAYLKRHPLCARCPQATPATVVDHVQPHRGDKRLFWLATNHQPLCKRCHDRKTVLEDGGLGRVRSGVQAPPPVQDVCQGATVCDRVGGGESLAHSANRPKPQSAKHAGSNGVSK